jgi:hypothetical protein
MSAAATEAATEECETLLSRKGNTCKVRCVKTVGGGSPLSDKCLQTKIIRETKKMFGNKDASGKAAERRCSRCRKVLVMKCLHYMSKRAIKSCIT